MNNLTPLTIIEEDSSIIIDKCYSIFKDSILNKDRPNLFGKKIYIPIEWYEYKAEMFWHVSSINPKEILNIYPCNNDLSYSICDSNCINKTIVITLKNGETRYLCYYRMIRVNWIREIIDMANNGDDRVKIWKKTQKNKRENLYLRYECKEVDYIIVFEIKANMYVFKSAYPVFYINSKKNHTKDYNEYIKIKSR